MRWLVAVVALGGVAHADAPCADVGACLELAKQHDHDDQWDIKVAAYQRACDLGGAAGCEALGTLYRQGWESRGVRHDAKHAAPLLGRACDGGVFTACDDLGLLLSDDADVPRDLDGAIRLLRKACDGKAFHGCTSLGYAYQTGRGVTRDLVVARSWYLHACDGGDYQGCDNTALLDERIDPPAAAHALMMFERGCALHSGYGCRRAGEAYRAVKDPRASARFVTACALHETDACYAWCELHPGKGECMQRALAAH